MELKKKKMNNQIGPTVTHVWNVVVHVLRGACHKQNSLHAGPIQPPYSPTEEPFPYRDISKVFIAVKWIQKIGIQKLSKSFKLVRQVSR